MDAARVPTARFAVCDTPAAAQAAIGESAGRVVIKADGLAAGKGVFVCSTPAEAERAVRACLVEGRFGQSGARVLVEELMHGPEVSVLAHLRRRARAGAAAGPRCQARAGRRRRPQHRRHGLHLTGAGAGGRDAGRDRGQRAPAGDQRAGAAGDAVSGLPVRRADADRAGAAGAGVQRPLRRPRGAGRAAAPVRRPAGRAAGRRVRLAGGRRAGHQRDPQHPPQVMFLNISYTHSLTRTPLG